MTPRPLFPKARPTKAAPTKLPRRPRDWRSRTHVMIRGGHATLDGKAICEECGFTDDHAIHDLNQEVRVEASKLNGRVLGERG